MAKNDVFYRRVTSGYAEIANLDIIQTKGITKRATVVPALTHPAWPCPSFLWPYLSPTSCEAQTADISQ